LAAFFFYIPSALVLIVGISSLIYDSWKKDTQFKKYDGIMPMLEGVDLRGKVLDVGIGTGLFEEYLRARGIKLDVTGIDPDPIMLEKALARGYRAVTGAAESLPFGDSAFDFVLCLDTIHVTDATKAVAEMKRVLKPGGAMLVAAFCNTFTKQSTMSDLESLLAGMEVVSKGFVGRSDDEMSAVLVCRK